MLMYKSEIEDVAKEKILAILLPTTILKKNQRRLEKIKTYLPAILTLQKKRGENLSFFPLLIYSCSSTCIKKGSEKLAAELNIQEINSEEAAEELKYFRSRSSRHFQKISIRIYLLVLLCRTVISELTSQLEGESENRLL